MPLLSGRFSFTRRPSDTRGLGKDVRTLLRQDPVWACVWLMLWLVPLACAPWYIESYDTLKYGIAIVGTLLAYACALRRGVWSTTVYSRRAKVVLAAVAFFILWSVLSTVFAFDSLYAVVGFYNRFANSLVFHLVFVLLILLMTRFDRDQRRALLVAGLSSGIIVAVWSLLQSVGVGYVDLRSDALWQRAPGLLGNPNFTGMYLATLLPISTWLAATAVSYRAQVWFGTGTVLLLLAVGLSGSRGALLGCAIGAVVGMACVWRYHAHFRKSLAKGAVLLVLTMILGALLLTVTRPDVWQRTFVLSDSNIHDRFTLWRMAVDATIKRPVLGIGLGNMLYVFERERPTDFYTDAVYDDAHNFVLQWAATGGIPLVLAGCLLYALVLYYGWRSARAGDGASAAIVAGAVIWFVAALFTPVSIPNYFFLAVILGFLISGDEARTFRVPIWVRRIGVTSASLGVLVVVLALVGELYSGLGARAYGAGHFETSMRYLQRGTHLNPTNPYARFFYAGSVVQARASDQTVQAARRGLALLHPGYNRTTIWLAHIYALEFYAHPTPAGLVTVGQELDRAVQAEPLVRYYRYVRAQYYILAGRPGEAREEMHAQVMLDPQYYKGWLLLARIAQLEHDAAGFIRAVDAAYALVPDETLQQARLRAEQGQPIDTVPLQAPNSLGDI